MLARSLIMAGLSFAALRGRRLSVLGSRPRLLRGVLGFGALSCFYHALVHLPLADATVIQYTNPAFTAVFALRERMRRREVLCLLLSLGGVVLVARPAFIFGGAAALPAGAAAIGLLGALLSAAAYVVVRMLGTEHYLVVIFYFAVISSIGGLHGTLLDLVLPTPIELLLLAGVGVRTPRTGLHDARPSSRAGGRATATALIQIVFAGILGVIFFRDLPDAAGLTGAALVMAGVLLLGRAPR